MNTHLPAIDLDLLERWLAGWSLSRGVPLAERRAGGLVVEVGWPEQLRRHVFVDAGSALRDCAAQIHEPFVFLKAAVDNAAMRRALPGRWAIEAPRYLMCLAGPMAAVEASPGYFAMVGKEHGAYVVRFADASGEPAAIGRIVLHDGTAVFDRIETSAAHRRRGLARAVMSELDRLAQAAGATERLLVATAAGRALYELLGWRLLAPYATAVLAPQR